MFCSAVGQLGHPFVEFGGAVALQRVLVCALLWRPPTRMSWIGCRKSRAPGHLRRACARRRVITVGRCCRARQRLQRDEDDAGVGGPPPPPPPPVKPTTLCTAGSCCTMSHESAQLLLIAWNEMLWSACRPPISRPVSCCGKKPFGTIAKRRSSARWSQQHQQDEKRWRSAQVERPRVEALRAVEQRSRFSGRRCGRPAAAISAHIIGVVVSETTSDTRSPSTA